MASDARKETAVGAGALPVVAWWLGVLCAGLLVIAFSREFLPAKFSLDAELIYRIANSPDLWDGWSFDSYQNTARFWALVMNVMPVPLAIAIYYGLMTVIAARLLNVTRVDQARYQLLAGGWIVCSAIFLAVPNKEFIALPLALWLCVATSAVTRVIATLLFLTYAAFFRQYWLICYGYYLCTLLAMRMHVAGRSRLAAVVMLVGFAMPFVFVDTFGWEPLTEARTGMNVDRVDSPDARTAFDNTFANTGAVTDMANTVVAWIYMNVPFALLVRAEPHYIFFAAFQLFSLWFFAAGFRKFLGDARRLGNMGSVYPRCAAFVVAYSLTQAMFEPDFGSFLRHEVIFMIPMLVVVFYRAHTTAPQPQQRPNIAYGGNVSAYL